MDRCRRCGYALTGDELREREYADLLRAKSAPSPAAESAGESDDGERGLFS